MGESDGVEAFVEPSFDQVFSFLSERGRLEWELGYKRAVIALLRDGG